MAEKPVSKAEQLRLLREGKYGNTKEASGTAREAPGGPLLGGPSRYAPEARTVGVKPQVMTAQETGRGEAEHSSRLISLRKAGRPNVVGEPWKAAGVSRSTWYRRLTEKAKREKRE
jgi:hypothetical protein